MKKIYTSLLLIVTPILLSAQQNFYKFSIGAGAGLTESHGDLSTSQAKKLYLANADYYFTPFVHSGIEVQTGNMGGLDASNDRYFTNNYKSVSLTGKLHLGQFLGGYKGSFNKESTLIKAVSGLYAGLGGGVIQVKQTQIHRQANDPLMQGSNSDKEIFFPFSLGIDNSGYNSRIVAGIRYQYNYVMGDQVDGYSRAGSRNDMYSTFTLSLKYKFGGIGIY